MIRLSRANRIILVIFISRMDLIAFNELPSELSTKYCGRCAVCLVRVAGLRSQIIERAHNKNRIRVTYAHVSKRQTAHKIDQKPPPQIVRCDALGLIFSEAVLVVKGGAKIETHTVDRYR